MAKSSSARRIHTRLLIKRMTSNVFFMVGGIVVILLVLLAVFAPIIITHDPIETNIYNKLQPPQWFSAGKDGYILGTDYVGRDIFARLLMGSRNSFVIASFVVVLAMALGTTLGIIAGYFGGIIDTVIMRMCDVMASIPQLVFAMAFIVVLGEGKGVLIGVLAITSWVGFCRQIRNAVSVMKSQEFVKASKTLGAKTPHIMFSQILPNVVTPLLILTSQRFGLTILAESSISYLGLGIRAPAPSWGNMISEGRTYLAIAPWVVFVPGVALMITVLAFNFLGDGLRDVLDPKRQ